MSRGIIVIKKIDFNNPAEVEEAAGVIIDYDLFVEAYLLYAKLRELESPPERMDSSIRAGESTRSEQVPGTLRVPGTESTLNKLKWVALPKFSEDEIVKMFGESFTTIFEIEDYDLWGKVKQKIVADIWYEDRDNFKKAIGKALLKNTERLTSQNIIINGKEEHPTVGNWLKDYNVNLGFAPVNAAKQSEYLTNSGNMKRVGTKTDLNGLETDGHGARMRGNGKLEGREKVPGTDENMSEKDKLKILFNFYEKLKVSSLTAEGLEEDIFIDEDGVRGILSGGTFTKIDPKMEQRLAELQGIIDNSQKSIKSKVHKVEGGEISELHAARMPWENGNRIKNQELRIKNGGDGGKGIKNQELRIKNWEEGEEIEKLGKEGGEGKLEIKKLEIEKLRHWENTEERANKAYIFSLDDQKVIKENEEDIKRRARGNIILVGKELTRALEEKNRPRVIAALRIAVKNNLLLGWAEKNQTEVSLRATTEVSLRATKERSNPDARGNNSGIASSQKLPHSSSIFVPRNDSKMLISFLRKILEQRLGLNEHEAAKIGVHIYNLFRKLGRDVGYLGYYDEQEKKFRWMENQ